MLIIHGVYPKILHKHCFLFILVMTVVWWELEDNAYAKYWGEGGGRVNRLYCKQCENGKFWSLPSVPLALVLLWRREKEEKDEVIYLSCSPYRLVIFSWFLLKNFHAKRRPLVLLATVPMIWIMSCVRTILPSKACFSNLKIKLNQTLSYAAGFLWGRRKVATFIGGGVAVSFFFADSKTDYASSPLSIKGR